MIQQKFNKVTRLCLKKRKARMEIFSLRPFFVAHRKGNKKWLPFHAGKATILTEAYILLLRIQ